MAARQAHGGSQVSDAVASYQQNFTSSMALCCLLPDHCLAWPLAESQSALQDRAVQLAAIVLFAVALCGMPTS